LVYKSEIQKIANYILSWVLKFIYRLWRKINRESNPRKWSNDELKKTAHLFRGDVINISAGKDLDKEGMVYRKYFKNATSYLISNYKKEYKTEICYDEIELDLSTPLLSNSDLICRFDVVFSHTVLEHVYDTKVAIRNLCKMSKDIIITIVPFIQSFHHDEMKDYHDYWRISPYAIINLFNEHDFKTIYITWNNDPIGNIYLFHIASKHPERWNEIIRQNDVRSLSYGPGYYRQLLLGTAKNCPNAKIAKLNDLL